MFEPDIFASFMTNLSLISLTVYISLDDKNVKCVDRCFDKVVCLDPAILSKGRYK